MLAGSNAMSKPLRGPHRALALLIIVGLAPFAPARVVAEPTPLVRQVQRSNEVGPSLAAHLQVYYDFEHPAPGNPGRELDLGLSGTHLALINGGPRMRVKGGPHDVSPSGLELGQIEPASSGNDDWKAGVFDANGVATLSAFNAVQGTSLLAWVEMFGNSPGLNSNTPEPADRYNAIGLVGLLSGDSDGHGVRALLELIQVQGTLRLVALGRRLDGGRSQIFAARDDWRALLPVGQWVHLAASFDFSTGSMKLYRNGEPIAGAYTATDDPWALAGGGDLRTSATNPRGIKIGGSFPQNTREANPCPCRMDDVMMLDRVLTEHEINEHYQRALRARQGRSVPGAAPRGE
jgi:Concanavalin A-like lectin/glucanases superfamily